MGKNYKKIATNQIIDTDFVIEDPSNKDIIKYENTRKYLPTIDGIDGNR